MFTGIIEALGRVSALDRRGGDARLSVHATWPDAVHPGVAMGDSVAINGTCLTVVSFAAEGDGVLLGFDASHETLAKTSLGDLAPGAKVNLERALRVGDRMGGHWVTGHVDATGRLVEVKRNGEAWDLSYQLPAELEPEVVAKGSICIDGVSLTVNRVWPRHFSVTIIPHTASHTQLLDRGAGATVNLETDLVGKYLRRFVALGGSGGLDRAKLEAAGFA